MDLTYILPIRGRQPMGAELVRYLRWLRHGTELIVVDGSDADVFTANAGAIGEGLSHVPPDRDLLDCENGKAAGVVTGLRRASSDFVIAADDDVRYDAKSLAAMRAALEDADIVRPQNYFSPLPWHARFDTGRTLINRVTGGDWPGTLGVRRHAIPHLTYDTNVLFENLELVRTVVAAGGREEVPNDLYVRRLPPSARHFWSQRVRQAYDEFARPARLAVWLSLLPLACTLASMRRWRTLVIIAASLVSAAETGRRRAGGSRVFPWTTAFCAPLWVVERAVCAWLAVGARLVQGGVAYHGRVVRRAATSRRDLERRLTRGKNA